MDNTAPAQVLEMRLIQYRRAGQICAALVRDVETVQMLGIQDGTYGLAQRAVQEDRPLRDIVESVKANESVSYQSLIDAGALLPPIMHPDPAHCRNFVTAVSARKYASATSRRHLRE